MPNGEKRLRFKQPDGFTVTSTIANQWKPEEGLSWQEPHFHKGISESYFLISGEVWFVWCEGNLVFSQNLKEPGENIDFKPLVPHLVILAPGAHIVTAQSGQEVGNPDRKGNDWYPVEDTFWSLVEEEQKTIEYLLRCSYSALSLPEVPIVDK